MNNSSAIICQWSGCKGAAARHVSFKYRRTEPAITSADGVNVYENHELDLCDSHIAEIHRLFLIVTEVEIGESSDKHTKATRPKLKRAA